MALKKYITRQLIKEEFAKAESNLEYCWQVLVDLKTFSFRDNDFGQRFGMFQDKLATTIFSLQSVRDKIILEEKETVINKRKCKHGWFLAKVRRLAEFKEGMDRVVATAKTLGDAYAYFFYQRDRKLFAEHLTHQRVINHTAGLGERGELEFVRNMKQVEGQFTLYHGITNVLRYGDFSFIDLKALRVKQIGELKTSRIDDNRVELKMTLMGLKESLVSDTAVTFSDPMVAKDRRERQLIGIENLLKSQLKKDDSNSRIGSGSYATEVGQLIQDTKPNSVKTIKVSAGLAFSCVRFKKASLYRRTFCTNPEGILENSPDDLVGMVQSMVKSDSVNNGIVLGQLLYTIEGDDKSLPGTIPLFWHELEVDSLKKLYFRDCIVTSVFNPAHVIDRVEGLGFSVGSRYNKHEDDFGPFRGQIQHFDYFLPQVMDYLLHEEMIVESILQILDTPFGKKPGVIKLMTQHDIDIFPIRNNEKQSGYGQ